MYSIQLSINLLIEIGRKTSKALRKINSTGTFVLWLLASLSLKKNTFQSIDLNNCFAKITPNPSKTKIHTKNEMSYAIIQKYPQAECFLPKIGKKVGRKILPGPKKQYSKNRGKSGCVESTTKTFFGELDDFRLEVIFFNQPKENL